jgi:DNA-binding SARP family transcriptional activator
VLFAGGEEADGLDAVAEGIRKGLELAAEAEVAQSRVYEAMLLRAAGRPEDSLTSAERAYERLCVQDLMDFRRLAALEVAASLLALGDASAARAWAESTAEAGFGENLHHAFRGAMVLALCDVADGNRGVAVPRLTPHLDHVRSGNSNFQAAIYARAFPDLLGMFAQAFGASELPIHLLRMIPSKNAEQILRACREDLGGSEWETLGCRLLGESQFSAFLERKGRPLCRVRLFGGLSVSVGDRTVPDREWKKRKARMLFAMLVARRGQEIAREQIFDLLWPELPEDRAKNNFYVAWSAMKAALMGQTASPGGCPYVDNAGGRCRVVPTAVRSDLDEFEEALRAGREAETNNDAAGAIGAYERIAAVYHGDLLESDPYEEWVAVLRDRYRFEFISAMLRLSELLLDRDDPCQALVHVRRAIQTDPQREDLYQMALRCHIAAGQRSAAVETYLSCRTQLAEELGLDPSAETVALYQQILVMEDRPRADDYGLT